MTGPSSKSTASLLDALIPITALAMMLALSVILFGSDSSSGPNQIVLALAAAIGSIVAIKNGHKWHDLQRAMVAGVGTAMVAIMILLCVGALIGTWLMAGTVPSLIYYGMQILSPQWFYAAACVICAVAALATGSSWTVAGTLGVALIGVSMGLGLSPATAAGAIIGGAYFGDKMSRHCRIPPTWHRQWWRRTYLRISGTWPGRPDRRLSSRFSCSP
jgi:NhaC family Na+:H+ antiporter